MSSNMNTVTSSGQPNLADQLIAAQTINALQNAFSSNTGLTFAGIASLFIVIFLDCIKKLIIKCVEEIIQHIEENKLNIVKMTLQYINPFKCSKHRKNHVSKHRTYTEIYSDKKRENVCNVSFKPTLTFWNSLYHNFKINPESININISSNFSTEQKNNTTYINEETWNNIIIRTPKMTASVVEQVVVTSNIESTHRTITKVDTNKSIVVLDENIELKSVIDFVPFPHFCKAFKSIFEPYFQNIIKKIGGVNKLKGSDAYDPQSLKKIKNHREDHHHLFDLIMDEIVDIVGLSEKTDAYIICKCRNELVWLTSLIRTYTAIDGATKNFNWNRKSKHTFLGLDITLDENEQMYMPYVINALEELPDVLLVKNWLSDQLIEGSKTNRYDCVNVKLISETLTPTEMNCLWIEHINNFQQTLVLHSTVEKQKYGIYTLKVQEVEKTLYRDNPNYEQWCQRREEIKEMMKNQNYSKEMCAELAKNLATIDSQPEVKQIEYKQVQRTVIKEHINDTKKDFGTLYLSKEDKSVLENCMFQFKEKKELLKELGIPNKLGIMLYGLPGTGKTSTINAIATYLQKNLYYINMNSVKSNADLKQLFDYVNKNCIGGGIIIMEDIDAMTSVVHARKTSVEERAGLSNTEVLETTNSALTLEFFLNILQGSLTADGSIFICTTNHIEKLDTAFCRDGRFDVKIEMKPSDHHQFQEMYFKYFKERIPDEVIKNIPEYKFVPATVLTRLARYIHQKATPEEILQPFIVC